MNGESKTSSPPIENLASSHAENSSWSGFFMPIAYHGRARG
jgi:hypothetical protein